MDHTTENGRFSSHGNVDEHGNVVDISDRLAPARNVACPRCHAAPGERCRHWSGQLLTGLHVRRRLAAAA